MKGLFTAKYNRSYANILYTKDATTSGPQFISLLKRDPLLANLSNMISKTPQDIYTTVLNAITQKLDQHYEDFLNPSFRILFNYTLEQVQCIPTSTIKASDDILQEIRDYILIDCNTDTTDALKRLVTRMNKAMLKANSELKEVLIKLQNITVTNFEPKITTPTKEIFLQLNLRKQLRIYELHMISYLSKLRSCYLVYKSKYILPFPVLNRNVLKKLVMPDGYNAGDVARTKALEKFYKESFAERGYSIVPYIYIKLISFYINSIYTKISFQILPGVKRYKALCSTFVGSQGMKNQPLTIDMPHLTWQLHKWKQAPETDKRIRIPTKGLSSSTSKETFIKFRLYTRTKDIDQDAMITTFASIFIHGIDAYVVQEYFLTVKLINTYITDNNLDIPLIIPHANHDAFGILMIYSHYLKYIVAHCYNKAVYKDFLELLNTPATEHLIKEIRERNPILCIALDHFIKH